jgi:hypothetical protein
MIANLYPRRAPNMASRVFEGEAVLMNPADSALFNLNETATLIWLAADGRTALSDIVDRDICPHFAIDRETALQDAEEVVRSLAECSVLFLAEEPDHG